HGSRAQRMAPDRSCAATPSSWCLPSGPHAMGSRPTHRQPLGSPRYAPAMAERPLDDARDLLAFLDASPSPYHAAETAAIRLEEAGLARGDPRDDWSELGTGAFVVVQGGALVAWRLADADALDAGFRIVGAHTDSPNLRIKPLPDTGRAGYRQLGV